MAGSSETVELVRYLVERLIQKGLDLQSIPAFVRFLASTIINDASQSPAEINALARSHENGTVEIDEDILQLTRACLTEVSRWVPDDLAEKLSGFSDVTS